MAVIDFVLLGILLVCILVGALSKFSGFGIFSGKEGGFNISLTTIIFIMLPSFWVLEYNVIKIPFIKSFFEWFVSVMPEKLFFIPRVVYILLLIVVGVIGVFLVTSIIGILSKPIKNKSLDLILGIIFGICLAGYILLAYMSSINETMLAKPDGEAYNQLFNKASFFKLEWLYENNPFKYDHSMTELFKPWFNQ